jgi:endonuclease/exonuclease/phosphatase family metal-dependent hydrolase
MLAWALPILVAAQTFTIATLNTESGSDTQSFRVAELIRELGRVEIWAFQEVASEEAVIEFTVAASASGARQRYRYHLSTSGKNHDMHRENDHIAIVYNSTQFREVESTELHAIRSIDGAGRLGKPEWHLRGALLVRFQHIKTGIEFYVGNVHLKCCAASDDPRRHGPDIRAHQARLLKDWIERSDVPVILTGDLNIPIKPTSANGNGSSLAFRTLSEIMTWHRPSNPVKTFCGHLFDSMLDHVFSLTDSTLRVNAVEIGQPHEAYCERDEQGYPDHRPVFAEVELTP